MICLTKIPWATIFITSLIAGCGATNDVRKEADNSYRSPVTEQSSSKFSNKAPDTTNYNKILDDIGLDVAFDYGETHETVSQGKVTAVTVFLTPKFLKLNKGDKSTGKIIEMTSLLEALGRIVSNSISRSTGLSSNRVTLVINERKVKVKINAGSVIIDPDRGARILVSRKKDTSLMTLIRLIASDKILKSYGFSVEEANDYVTKLLRYLNEEQKTFNVKVVREFCKKELSIKLSKYDFESDCNAVDDYDGQKIIIIKDVTTTKFITNKFPEKFNIVITNDPEFMSSDGGVSIKSGNYAAIWGKRIKWIDTNYNKNIKDLKNGESMIESSEEKLSDIFSKYFSN